MAQLYIPWGFVIFFYSWTGVSATADSGSGLKWRFEDQTQTTKTVLCQLTAPNPLSLSLIATE